MVALLTTRDEARYWSKIAISFKSNLHLMPLIIGKSSFEYCHNVWYWNTEVLCGYMTVKRLEDMTPHINTTDTGRWHRQSIARQSATTFEALFYSSRRYRRVQNLEKGSRDPNYAPYRTIPCGPPWPSFATTSAKVNSMLAHCVCPPGMEGRVGRVSWCKWFLLAMRVCSVCEGLGS